MPNHHVINGEVKRCVAKTPESCRAVSQDNHEVRHFATKEKNRPFPFAHGYTEGSPSGNMVVIVKKITPIDPFDPQYPSWADQVDMGQVGVDENGVVMTYDL